MLCKLTGDIAIFTILIFKSYVRCESISVARAASMSCFMRKPNVPSLALILFTRLTQIFERVYFKYDIMPFMTKNRSSIPPITTTAMY